MNKVADQQHFLSESSMQLSFSIILASYLSFPIITFISRINSKEKQCKFPVDSVPVRYRNPNKALIRQAQPAWKEWQPAQTVTGLAQASMGLVRNDHTT